MRKKTQARCKVFIKCRGMPPRQVVDNCAGGLKAFISFRFVMECGRSRNSHNWHSVLIYGSQIYKVAATPVCLLFWFTDGICPGGESSEVWCFVIPWVFHILRKIIEGNTLYVYYCVCYQQHREKQKIVAKMHLISKGSPQIHHGYYSFYERYLTQKCRVVSVWL